MQPRLFIFITLIVVLLAACSAPAQPTVLPTETSTPAPSLSPEPTFTLTPLPTDTALPLTPLVQEKYWLDEQGNVKPGYAIPVAGKMFNVDGVDRLGIKEAGAKSLHELETKEIFVFNVFMGNGNNFTRKYLPGGYDKKLMSSEVMAKIDAAFEVFYQDALNPEMRFDNVSLPSGWDGKGQTLETMNLSMVVVGEIVNNVDFSVIHQVVLSQEQVKAELEPTLMGRDYPNAYGPVGDGTWLKMIETVPSENGIQLVFKAGSYREGTSVSNMQSYLVGKDSSAVTMNQLIAVDDMLFAAPEAVFDVKYEEDALNLQGGGDFNQNRARYKAQNEEMQNNHLREVFGEPPYFDLVK